MVFGTIVAVASGLVNAVGYTVQKRRCAVDTNYVRSPLWVCVAARLRRRRWVAWRWSCCR